MDERVEINECATGREENQRKIKYVCLSKLTSRQPRNGKPTCTEMSHTCFGLRGIATGAVADSASTGVRRDGGQPL